jgi:hypothetical protein
MDLGGDLRLAGQACIVCDPALSAKIQIINELAVSVSRNLHLVGCK